MRVLIGYDGSEHSDAAIEDLKLAGLPRDCKVMITSVADPLSSSPELSEVINQTLMFGQVAGGVKEAANPS